ncbi:hypothetical protein G6F32_015072 [Rhizopus arrhizus]|nr:hypothetical protein G6F32_015072 [Rhizopus arrhizus]
MAAKVTPVAGAMLSMWPRSDLPGNTSTFSSTCWPACMRVICVSWKLATTNARFNGTTAATGVPGVRSSSARACAASARCTAACAACTPAVRMSMRWRAVDNAAWPCCRCALATACFDCACCAFCTVPAPSRASSR